MEEKKTYTQIPIEIDVNKKKSNEEIIDQLEREQPHDISPTLFEDLINQAGMTRFQVRIFFLTGLIYFIEGLHVSLTGLLFIPIIRYHKVSSVMACLISSSIVLFMGLGSISIGYLPFQGRRKMRIFFSLFVISIATCFGYINNSIVLLLSRSIIGFCLGIVIPLATNNYCEILPTNFRSFWIITVTSLFSIGGICSCQLMCLTLDNINLFFLIQSIPCFIIVLLVYFFYLESPRYLILNDNHEKGFKLIEQYFNQNKKLEELEIVQIIKGIDRGMNKEVKLIGKVKFVFSRYSKITIILTIIWIFYSIMLNGGLFNFFVGLTYSTTINIAHLSIEDYVFTFRILQIFYTFFSISTIISGLITEIKFCGRKYTVLFGFLLSVLVCVLSIFKSNHFGFFILGSFFVNISFNALNSYTIEVFPTRVRDFAIGYLTFLSKMSGFLSNIMTLILYKYSEHWNFYLNAIIGIIGLVATILLPFDTYNRDLDKNLDKKQNQETKEEIII